MNRAEKIQEKFDLNSNPIKLNEYQEFVLT